MIENPANFHQLDGRLRLRGVLTFQTALHVGAGKATDEATDLPVLRDAQGHPFLPGASIKGVLRSTLESLVRSASEKSTGFWACDPLVDKPNKLAAGLELACGVHEPGKRSGVDIRQHCTLCQIFGSRVLASHVRVSDALIRDRDQRPPIELRDGVAIDRDRRVVYGGQKYDFEVVAPGTQFNLEVFVENPQPWMMGLLTIGFDQIADGFTTLGGFSSRGLGRATLEWTDVLEFSAAQLLAGNDPESLKDKKLETRQKEWRAALAAKVPGKRS